MSYNRHAIASFTFSLISLFVLFLIRILVYMCFLLLSTQTQHIFLHYTHFYSIYYLTLQQGLPEQVLGRHEANEFHPEIERKAHEKLFCILIFFKKQQLTLCE